MLDSPLSHALLKSISRHFVGLLVSVAKGREEAQRELLSALLLSIKGRCLIVTAGHSIVKINKALAQGYEFKGKRILDVAESATNPAPLSPILPWDAHNPTGVFDESNGVDYGFFEIDSLTRGCVEQQGKRFIDESGWEDPAPSTNQRFIYGVATDDRTYGKTEGRFQHSMWLVELCDRPEHVAERAMPCLYGRIPGDTSESIVGLSGGPVFALDDSIGRYWLVAVQACWWPELRIVEALLIGPIAAAIEAHFGERGSNPSSANT
jgi:hypothetical protein